MQEQQLLEHSQVKAEAQAQAQTDYSNLPLFGDRDIETYRPETLQERTLDPRRTFVTFSNCSRTDSTGKEVDCQTIFAGYFFQYSKRDRLLYDYLIVYDEKPDSCMGEGALQSRRRGDLPEEYFAQMRYDSPNRDNYRPSYKPKPLPSRTYNPRNHPNEAA